VVTIKFLLKRDIDEAANDVRDKVSAISLPKSAKMPLVSKLDIGGASVINLFVTPKDSKDYNALMPFVDDKIKPLLQKVTGVGAINIVGFRDKEIKIYPNPTLLTKYGISIRELNNIVARENIKLSGGKLIDNKKEYILKVESDAKSIDELKDIKIKPGVRLKDVAVVAEALSDAKSYSNLDGVPGVMLEIKKISGANTIEVVDGIKSQLPYIKSLAKDRYNFRLLNDTTIFIKHSLADVKFDLIYGVILSIIIIFIFLRNFTITFVSALSIPTSVFGTFALMNYMGFDLNKLTLLGLTLAIGIIIDDAIVIVENIYKKLESGKGRLEAAFWGVKEIVFAVVAITAMLLAVFIPVGSMSGIVGKFFESFAITVSFAIIISFTIAITLIPSVSARVLKGEHSWFYKVTEPFFRALEKFYTKILAVALRFKVISLIVVLAIFVGSLSLFPKIGMDFIPKEDKSEFEIKLKAKPGISLQEMIRQTKEVQSFVKKDKNVEYTTLMVAYNSAQEINKAKIYVKLLPIEKRAKRQDEIIQGYREKLKRFEDRFFITAAAIPNIKGAGADVPFQIVLKSDNYEHLKSSAKVLIAKLKAKKGFKDIDSNLDDGKPQYKIKIDKEAASRLGISAKQIAEAINVAFSSDKEISYFEKDGKQYDITLRFGDKDRVGVADLSKVMVRSKSGALIGLDSLIDIKKGLLESSIYHYDRERQVSIYADLFGLDLGGAIKYTNSILPKVLSKDISYRYTGFAEEMGKTTKAFGVAFATAAILMFIILAILYESLVQPIIIMMALPLSITGVLLALYLNGMHFSLFVFIGFLMLMGMVGKNAVLIVDFANSAVKEGKSVDSALIDAGDKRLRPILMTTFAMIFAMLPLAMGTGIGSELKAPMAISIIGGLISSMILTLIVVPIIYKMLYRFDRFLRRAYEVGEIS
jgi:HAE1 family hydrophobic/amphiphilic exporter-1